MGVITEENYSLQAKNLLDSIVEEYLIKIEKLHTDNFYFHELKKMRFKINNRTRKFSDLSEIKNNFNDNFFQIIVFNIDYINLITDELTLLSYSYETKGQIINVLKKELKYNEIITIVEDLDKLENKILTQCSKARLEPILRAKNALENDFIEQNISRETAQKCQIYFSNAEKKIFEISLKKKKEILGVKFFQKYEIESLRN